MEQKKQSINKINKLCADQKFKVQEKKLEKIKASEEARKARIEQLETNCKQISEEKKDLVKEIDLKKEEIEAQKKVIAETKEKNKKELELYIAKQNLILEQNIANIEKIKVSPEKLAVAETLENELIKDIERLNNEINTLKSAQETEDRILKAEFCKMVKEKEEHKEKINLQISKLKKDKEIEYHTYNLEKQKKVEELKKVHTEIEQNRDLKIKELQLQNEVEEEALATELKKLEAECEIISESIKHSANKFEKEHKLTLEKISTNQLTIEKETKAALSRLEKEEDKEIKQFRLEEKKIESKEKLEVKQIEKLENKRKREQALEEKKRLLRVKKYAKLKLIAQNKNKKKQQELNDLANKQEARILAEKRAKIKLEEDRKRKKIKEQKEQLNLKKWQDSAFLRGRAVWNGMYDSAIERTRKYRYVCMVLAACLFCTIIGLTVVASQSKIVPYAVQVGSNGEIMSVSPAEKASGLDKKIIKYFVQNFIVNLRAVSGDNTVEKERLAKVYASVNVNGKGNALKMVKEYINSNNPFTINSKNTIEVKIKSAMPLSDKTYQIEWTETERTLAGQVVSQKLYQGQLTYELGEAKGLNFEYNPFGIFIKDITWSSVDNNDL